MFRLMSYNIEWFTKCFEDDNSLKTTTKITERIDAIATVISTIDPDVIGITEAPNTTTTTGQRSTVTALENFAAAKGLRQRKAMIGFPSAGQQEIAILFDPNKASVAHDPGGQSGTVKNPPFNEAFNYDTNGDGIREIYKHFRPPLEAQITRTDGGADFWMMVVHAKSKGIFNAMDRIHFDRTSERNRRKLFAECGSIRSRVDQWLEQDRPTVVMGDINDGPGFDFYEEKFGRSAVELLMGDIFEPDNILRNHVGRPVWGNRGWMPSTTRFKDEFTGDRVDAIIDHILASHHLQPTQNAGLVWNPNETAQASSIRTALNTASDHYPVTLEIS
ncbi:Endonuclease/Exonuclease/phosphatase family protein [Roseovarius albus]|uniref:Endonuclease/Exonuclease/phosphatase family protein n=1 Tax=Roseovarius albus TaxID=1247867 RepID=A0A1X6YMV4_9RHOB|nr:endonuclease/exonuclease/phosphatase family protein [Roseovarius albus]SLN26035.1 Endonuclease/Exonuclease/phosphatase family protein [Roseovarius albus]